MSGHTDTITSVAGNRTGSQVVTGGNDRVCRLYNVDRGEQVRVYEGAQDGISSVVQAADGSWIAASDRSGQVSMWKTETGDLIGSVRTHDSAITKIACSLTDRLLATSSTDGLIRIWRSPLTPPVQLQDPPQESVVLAISPNGQLIALGLADFSVAVRDTRTGEQLKTLTGHSKSITALAFSGDGSLIVSGSQDGTVGLWNVENGERLIQWDGHTSEPRAVAVLSNGDELRACSSEGRLTAYFRANREQRVLQEAKKGISAIAISPSGKRLALANTDGSVQLVDAETGTLIGKTPSSDRVFAIDWCADDESWVSFDSAQAVKYWKLADLDPSRGWTNAPKGVNSISLSSDGSKLLTTGAGVHPTIWSAEGNLLQKFDWDTKVNVQSLTLSADGSVAVVVGNDGKLTALHSSLINAFRAHEGSANLVGFADDRIVISAGADSTISAWDIGTGTRTRQYEGCPSRAIEMVISTSAGKLIVLGEDRKLYAWDLVDGSPIKLPSTFGNPIFRRIGLSPDGQQVAALDDKSRFRILKVADFSEAGELPSPVADATSIELLRDGTVISASESLAFISRGEASEAGFKAHEGAIVGLNAIPNREEFLTAGEDGKVKVWSLSGELTRTWVDTGSPIRQFAMRGDGKEVAVLGNDNKVKIWNDTGDTLGSFSVPARLKSMQYSDQSASIIATVSENQIKLFQTAKGKPVATISTIGKTLASAIDSEQGAVYVSGAEGGLLKYAVLPVKTIEAEQKEIQSLAFSRNGSALASGGDDFSVCVCGSCRIPSW